MWTECTYTYVCQLVYFLLLFKVFVAQKSQVPFQPNHLHILPCIERLTRCLDLCGGLVRFTELKQYYRLLNYELHIKIYIDGTYISYLYIMFNKGANVLHNNKIRNLIVCSTLVLRGCVMYNNIRTIFDLWQLLLLWISLMNLKNM